MTFELYELEVSGRDRLLDAERNGKLPAVGDEILIDAKGDGEHARRGRVVQSDDASYLQPARVWVEIIV